MDEVFGPRTMVAQARLKALSVKSDRRGWLQVASHFGAIGLTTYAMHATMGTLWLIPAFFAHGVLLNYLRAGQHEFCHSTVFNSSGLNEFFGRLIGFITLHPRDWDQLMHFSHHRYTQQWDQDGELGRPRYTLRGYLLFLTGVTFYRAITTMMFRNAIGRVAPFVRGQNVRKVILESRITLALYSAILAVSVVFHSWAALVYWLAPLGLTKWTHQLQSMMEHNGMPHHGAIFENTRTTKTNALMRWMGWNMQYHTAHHAYPSVPFYRLKAMHHEAFTANGLKPATMTYLGFQIAMIRALRAKPESEQPDDKVWVGQGLTRISPRAVPSEADMTAA